MEKHETPDAPRQNDRQRYRTPVLQTYDSYHGVQVLGSMWTLRKGPREVVCQLSTHPLGWELRASVDGDDFLRTHVCRLEADVFDTANAWRVEATAKGWQDLQHSDPTDEEFSKPGPVVSAITGLAFVAAEMAHRIPPHDHQEPLGDIQLGSQLEQVMTSAPNQGPQIFPAARKAR